MHETADDLAKLQDLLDRSYAAGGEHLKRIITPERRLSAAQVAERLTGMSLLSLATVTADCRPLVGPVDGVFFRGAFYFGSAPDSMRMRHLRARPQVSATHVPREELSVTVHGRATFVDAGLGRVCDPTSAESVADALRWFLDHPVERDQMGHRGQTTIAASWNYETTFAPVLRRILSSAASTSAGVARREKVSQA